MNLPSKRPPAIAGLELLLPHRTAALMDVATREATRFDAGAQALQELRAPTTALLTWAEGIASHRLGRWPVTISRVALAERGVTGTVHARLAARHVHATRAALRLVAPLDEQAVVEVNQAVDPRAPRFMQLPREDRIAVSDLVAFMRRSDLPALAQLAVAYAQLDSLSPFRLGNGATGRALVQGLAKAIGLVRDLPVPISAGLLGGASAYEQARGAYQAGNAAPVIEHFAKAALLAVASGRRLVADLDAVLQGWRRRLEGVRSDSLAWRLLPVVLGLPVFDAPMVAERLDASLTSLYKGMRFLDQRGIVVPAIPGRTTDKQWLTLDVIAVLDRFTVHANLGRYTELR